MSAWILLLMLALAELAAEERARAVEARHLAWLRRRDRRPEAGPPVLDAGNAALPDRGR